MRDIVFMNARPIRLRARSPATVVVTFLALLTFVTPTSLLAADSISQEAKTQASQFYEDAVARLNNRDFEGAIIQIKNALQKDPGMVAAQVLMGEAYLRNGDGAAAETALRRAAETGADESLVAVPMAKALVLQFKHVQLLKQPISERLSSSVRAELLETKARAALSINEADTVEVLLAELDRIKPESIPAVIVRATLAMRSGDYVRAEGLINAATEMAPRDSGIVLARASLLHIQGRLDEALHSYSEVIARDPLDIDARLARIGILLDLRLDSDTETDFSDLRTRVGADPRLGYLLAVKLARAGDEHGTRSALAEVANTIESMGKSIVTGNLQLLLVAGIANFSLGNFEAAQNYLQDYVAKARNDLGPVRMLATILLRKREFVKAQQLLEEFIDTNGESPQVLSLLASAYSGAGNHQRAATTLERAAAQAPNSATLAARLALAQASRGQVETALASLSDIFSDAATMQFAGLPLAAMYLNRGELAQALEVARQLAAREPENLTYLNLRAIAELGSGNGAVATDLWQQALKLDPAFLPAKINLAKAAHRAGRFPEAAQMFRDLLARHANDPLLQIELARILVDQGNSKEALKLARDAAAASPDSFEIANFLIDRLIADAAFEGALQVVWDQEQQHPNNLYVLEAQARIRLASGDLEALRLLLRRMADLAQFDAVWLQRIGEYQIASGELQDAHYSLFKAAQSEPRQFAVRVRLTELELQMGKPDAAAERANSLVTDFPDQAIGYALVGDVAAALGDHRRAAERYADALAQQRRPEFALKLHLAQRQLKDDRAATAVLEDWISDHPSEVWAHGTLGEFHMLGGRVDLAKRHFEELLKIQPDHAPTLNNLANVVLDLGDPNSAVTHARRALELQPDNPMITDTLGWSLVQAGNVTEALPYLREARARASTIPEVRYHLAVALQKLGRKEEALQEINDALKTPQEFIGRDEALRLRAEIGD